MRHETRTQNDQLFNVDQTAIVVCVCVVYSTNQFEHRRRRRRRQGHANVDNDFNDIIRYDTSIISFQPQMNNGQRVRGARTQDTRLTRDDRLRAACAAPVSLVFCACIVWCVNLCGSMQLLYALLFVLSACELAVCGFRLLLFGRT